MVDDHVARLGGNARNPVVVGLDGRDGFAFGVREWITGHEPVGPVHGPRAVRTAYVDHGAAVDGYRIEGNPAGADAFAGQVEVAQVLVQDRRLDGSRLLDQHRVLVEVDPVGAHEGAGDGR